MAGRMRYDDMSDPAYVADMQDRDVYEHMSYADVAMNDRYDYASEVAQYDPERAAEIRMGA